MHHVVVLVRVGQHVGHRRCCGGEADEEPHGFVLHRDALGVLERLVDERALLGPQRLVLARADHRGRGAQRAFDQRTEPIGDFAVGRFALAEPDVAQRAVLGVAFGGEPEIEHLACFCFAIGVDHVVPPSWRHR